MRWVRISHTKSFMLGIALFFGMVINQAMAQGDALTFAQRTADNAIEELTDKGLTAFQRVERMQEMIDTTFDVNAVSTFVLGPYASRATAKELSEFKRLYRVYVAHNYAGLFTRYSNVKVKMTKETKRPNGDTVVDGVIRQSDGTLADLRMQLRPTDNSFKAVDLHVEGVSMPLNHRKQFSSIIRQQGGSIKGLISALDRLVGKLQQAAASQ
jgi:phospholipid transport system substrate-binding protein